MDERIVNATTEYEERKRKLGKLIDQGNIPFKEKFDYTHKLSDITEQLMGKTVKICGRLISKRVMGKLIFANVYDVDADVQISISKKVIGESFDILKKLIDLGDFIGLEGEVYKTKAGEITVRVHDIILLSKSLRPLPEKFHGIADQDIKYRKRYLDLIANKESRDAFKIRLETLANIRQYLYNNDFLEVETPILQNVASGANARPFITKHNALDTEFYLRIAPELYLKQIVEGGFNRVFEIGKNFRNEGMDTSHLQEFTMLEWYAAYWDFNNNIDFIVDLMQFLVEKVKSKLVFDYQGISLDFNLFERINYCKELSGFLGTDILEFNDVEEIKEILHMNKMFAKEEIEQLPSIASAIDYIFKKKIRPNLIQPTILYNYPAYLIPLARRNDDNPKSIDMFQVVIYGWEIVKAYSELINPITQRETFEEQAKAKSVGDEEAMDIDENFITAMEHGMPPMSGLGLGVDRFIAILANQPSLRDVVFFPQMK